MGEILDEYYRTIEEWHGEEGRVFVAVAEGVTLRRIADDIGLPGPGPLYLWVRRGGPERAREYASARVAGAQAHADAALAVVEGATRLTVGAAREVANVRKWLAERYDRETFGPAVQAVQVSVQVLHLDALRAMPAPAAPAALPAGLDAQDVTPTLDDLTS